MLRHACEDAARWSRDVAVAVNLSPAQFKNRNLEPSISSALADSGLAANRLELEITESVFLRDSATTLEILHRLRDLGVRISMDDFGTGYSSLSYLRSFPFDKIKIDASFVRELASREDSMAIVRAVTGLARSLRKSRPLQRASRQANSSLSSARKVATRCRGICSAHHAPSQTSRACSPTNSCETFGKEWLRQAYFFRAHADSKRPQSQPGGNLQTSLCQRPVA